MQRPQVRWPCVGAGYVGQVEVREVLKGSKGCEAAWQGVARSAGLLPRISLGLVINFAFLLLAALLLQWPFSL